MLELSGIESPFELRQLECSKSDSCVLVYDKTPSPNEIMVVYLKKSGDTLVFDYLRKKTSNTALEFDAGWLRP